MVIYERNPDIHFHKKKGGAVDSYPTGWATGGGIITIRIRIVTGRKDFNSISEHIKYGGAGAGS